MDQFVATQDLQVGMYVHLDLPWMRHPFPRSSFRIGSAEQIEIIRSLGLQRVRWTPDQIALVADAAAGAGDDAVAHGEQVPAPADSAARADARAAAMPPQDSQAARPAQIAGEDMAPVSMPPAAHAVPGQQAHHRLQRAYAQARVALHEVLRSARTLPERAGAEAAALSRALVDRMLDDDQACIRLLASADADHATTHGMNVAVVALLLGRSLGLAGDELLDLGLGALLHDIGKVELPERLHAAPAAGADPDRVRGYREHVALGVRLGQRMGLAAHALTVLAQHHERDDGSGFPKRLAADRITQAARIVSLVDRYDNLCNPPRAGAALTPHEAMAALFRAGQGQDDPTTLAAFVRLMGVYPPGSLVELSDGRLAVVVASDACRPLKPCVRVHDPRRRADATPLLDLAAAAGLGIRRSLHAEALPPPARRDLVPCARLTYFFESRASATCPSGAADEQQAPPAADARDGGPAGAAATRPLDGRPGASAHAWTAGGAGAAR